jgi:hypothetical protein
MPSLSMPRWRYALGGVPIGGFWYLNRAHSPLEEAIRTLCVFALLLFLAQGRLRRKAITLHLIPLFLSKALLIVTAAIAETALAPLIANPAGVVAIGLGLAVALLGPLGDSRFFTRMGTLPAIAGDHR